MSPSSTVSRFSVQDQIRDVYSSHLSVMPFHQERGQKNVTHGEYSVIEKDFLMMMCSVPDGYDLHGVTSQHQEHLTKAIILAQNSKEIEWR